jgi:hypothetical protein
MEPTKSNTRILIWSIFFAMIPLTVYTQENSASVSNLQDTIVKVKPVSRNTLYTSLGYGNNMALGSAFSQAQPFYYGSLLYGYNNELFASVSTFHLSAFKPFLGYHTISLNYCHVFNSWFDISIGASRYQIAKDLADTLFNSFFYGNLNLGIDWKLLYSKLSVMELFSETSSTYFQIKNSRYFQTPGFFNNKAYISFDPYASFLFGPLTRTTTAEGTSTGISSPFHTGGSTLTSETTTIFGLMEISFGLPVGFNFGKLTVEAEPGYILPMYKIIGVSGPKGFTFLLNFSFKIF